MSFYKRLLEKVEDTSIQVTEYAPEPSTINAYEALEEGQGNSLISQYRFKQVSLVQSFRFQLRILELFLQKR